LFSITSANLFLALARAKNRLAEVMENNRSYLNVTRRGWQRTIIELRGWEGHQGSVKTNDSWLQYCKENNLCYDYDFGDVIS